MNTSLVSPSSRFWLLFQFVGRQARKLLFEETRPWLLALRERQPGTPPEEHGNGFGIIPQPEGHFYADPCLFKKDGRNYLFFEDYCHAAGKAVISCLELDPAGNWSEPKVVLDRKYHLSYPFVFQWQDEVYLIPETSTNRTIELYRALEFPYRWALDRVLLRNVRAADATVIRYHDKFWLFATLGDPGRPNIESLHLFVADGLEGSWRPHPKNPVVSDVRRARPAGRLFFAQGELIRPAQDCSVCYGHAIVFNRVEVMTEEDYREVPAGRIGPEWLPGSLATHTLTFNEDFEVRDARLRMTRPRWRT